MFIFEAFFGGLGRGLGRVGLVLLLCLLSFYILFYGDQTVCVLFIYHLLCVLYQ